MRPTGELHIGHYLGVLRNWVELQNSSKYNCFFFVADWHSLTTKYERTEDLQKNIIEVTRDFVASGLDPQKSTIYVQSAIPEIAELHLLLSMVTPNNWAERDPTLKDLVRALAHGKTSEQDVQNENGILSYGMLGYPILQTSDILTFRASLVPVGKDQVAHIEISRDIARRFNNIFGCDFFPEPKALLTETPTVKGTDGGKMSKSFNNDIKISAGEEETLKQVKSMITDSQRIKKSDPGSTERCEVPFPYYKIFADNQQVERVKRECESAVRGCFDCKKQLAEIMNDRFKEIRIRRKSFNDDEILNILKEGNEIARIKAQNNLKEVRKIIKLHNWN